MSGDIQRNTPVFWPCHTWRSQMSSIIAGVTWQKFTKFLHDIATLIATLSPLLKHAFRQWQCNSFSNDSAKNVSGISRRSWHFPKINWLPWQRPLTNRKTWYRSIVCTQSAFIWWKDCKNRSSISWHIWLNMPVFCHVVKKVYKWAPFSLELLDQSSRNFYTI